jgi:hypothetical protein
MSHIVQQGMPSRSQYFPKIDSPSGIEGVVDESRLDELL